MRSVRLNKKLCGLATWLVFAVAVQATGQPDPTTLHFNCTAPSTVCSNGSTTLITNNALPTFTITTQANSGLAAGQTGSLFMAVLVPTTAPSVLSFSVGGHAATLASGTFSGGTLWAFLNVTPQNTSKPDFSAFASASAQSGGGTPAGLSVYLVNFGAVTATGSDQTLATITSGAYNSGFNGFPPGALLYTFLTNCDPTATDCSNVSGQIAVNSSPLSESLTGSITVVSEPSSVILLGLSLLFLGGARRLWVARRNP